uniref:Small ribosomal subunit protein mS25 n=1 Tax=Gouania willdenowi TaxID=441366 RepID=A0A8C5D5W1_GOUWI
MPMKGQYPIRRTLEYLQKGNIIFKNKVKIMTSELTFVFFNIPQIQYKNPWLQIMMFKNMTPSPFLKFYLDDGEQVLMDVEGKDHKLISEHVKKILGKSEEVLKAEAQAKMQASNPANFGPKKYCLRECICEVEGQVPCPSIRPLPKEMTGKYRAQMAASQE